MIGPVLGAAAAADAGPEAAIGAEAAALAFDASFSNPHPPMSASDAQRSIARIIAHIVVIVYICGAQLFAANKCSLRSMAIRCRSARASIHDEVRPVSISRLRSYPPPIDVGTLTSQAPTLPPEDPVLPDPGSCAAFPRCSAIPTPEELHASGFRKPELSSPDIPAESCQSPAHKSNSPWDFETVSAAPSAPVLEPSCKVLGKYAVAIMYQIAVIAFISNHLAHLL